MVLMVLYYATTNTGKFISLQDYLKKQGIVVQQAKIDIPEPRSSDVQEIAQAKVAYAFNMLRNPVVVLDAGFYINELNGFPRAFVNFALETIQLEGILKLVEGKKRDCEFREGIAYLDKNLPSYPNPEFFIAHVRGKLAEKPRGQMQPYLWSKLGLIFIPEGLEKTLAEMSEEEYNNWRNSKSEELSVSKLFSKWYSEYLKNK